MANLRRIRRRRYRIPARRSSQKPREFIMSTKTFATVGSLIVISALTVFAQESRGTITGRTVDSTGAIVAGADVRAVNVDTGAFATSKTNEAGVYTIPYLVPGTYNVSAEFSGFKKTERPNVQVRVNDVLNIEFKLEIGSASESIEVKGGTPLLEASNVSLGQVVEERQIAELPIQAGNANELVLLTPGL